MRAVDTRNRTEIATTALRWSADRSTKRRATLAKPRATLAKPLAGLALLLALAGCGTADRMSTSSIPQDDYRIRHPILLANDTVTLDIFPSTALGALDRHSAKQVFAFARDYREAGHGAILVLVPTNTGAGVVSGVRRALAAGGVGAVEVRTYPVGDPALASPVRLSFTGLKAKVGDQCGQWPSDIGSGATVEEWANKPYYNFGCAQQSMIAAQTADPRDLVAPRGEEPADTIMRSRAIEKVRAGTDPTTTWTTHNSSIGSVGSN
jgi:pilus assembly protein CpaD